MGAAIYCRISSGRDSPTKIVRLLLALLIFSVSAAPLTHHDKEILKKLNVADTDALTQQSFNQLFYDATKDNKKIVLAAVKDNGSDIIFFFDLISLFSALETKKNFVNPLNRQEIQSIRIYRAPAERYFLTHKGLTHKTVGSFSISKPNPLTIDDFEFIGELHAKPQEGFYKYLKNHGIDPTNFTGPFKQYNPTNLPMDIEELRAIVHDDYPLPLETQQAATIRLAQALSARLQPKR